MNIKEKTRTMREEDGTGAPKGKSSPVPNAAPVVYSSGSIQYIGIIQQAPQL